MNVKVSKDKRISKWADQEKLIYVREKNIKNRRSHKDKEGNWYRKKN